MIAGRHICHTIIVAMGFVVPEITPPERVDLSPTTGLNEIFVWQR